MGPGLATALISGAVGILGNIVNWFSTKNTNESNQQINESQIDYQTAKQKQAWERDDNAHQREVADLEAAGLSPLANTTGSPVTSPLGAPSMLGMQAPQIDTNAIINSVLKSAEIEEEKRHNLVNEGHKNEELILEGEKIKNEAYSLEIQNKKVENDAKYQAALIEKENKALDEAINHNKEEEYLRRLEYESELYFKEIKQQVGGDYSYRDIYDITEYQAAISAWNTAYSKFLNELKATQTASATSKSLSGSGGFGVTGATIVGANAQGSSSETNSKYESENISQKQEEMIKKFYSEHPKPVYHLSRFMYEQNRRDKKGHEMRK